MANYKKIEEESLQLEGTNSFLLNKEYIQTAKLVIDTDSEYCDTIACATCPLAHAPLAKYCPDEGNSKTEKVLALKYFLESAVEVLRKNLKSRMDKKKQKYFSKI